MASNKRERELARLKMERQAARRAAETEARRRRRNTILSAVAGVAVLAAVVVIAVVTGGGDKKKTTASGCTYSTAGTASKKVDGLPPSKPSHKGDTKVVLTTSRGEIDLTLDGAKAPCTTNSFAFLAKQKYFDGTPCHRLTTQGIYVLQCGDPTGTGSGGPGYQFKDENLTALGAGATVTYPRGTVAMANAGAGTNGSQFFLVYKDSPLPPNYTPFGRITTGLDILDTVAKGGSTPPQDGAPKLAVKLETVTVKS